MDIHSTSLVALFTIHDILLEVEKAGSKVKDVREIGRITDFLSELILIQLLSRCKYERKIGTVKISTEYMVKFGIPCNRRNRSMPKIPLGLQGKTIPFKIDK
tara:strand:+ start:1163 stop:1468 length:306 start_codon:yes stop_codon:yes gene_type:complete